MIWFTADTHFDHRNIINYCNRPFKDVDDMNQWLVFNWNAVIDPRDTVYFLGDFAFKNHEYWIKQLKGHKILIVGSHDKELKSLCHFPYPQWAFEASSPMLEIKIDGQYITLCHYCMRVWPRSHRGSWHLYAHSHGDLEPIGKSWDVGIDNNNYFPVPWTHIKDIMAQRPDNFNHHMQEERIDS